MKSLRKMWPVIVLINFLLLINTYSCITQKTQCDSKNHSCALTQSSVLTRNILKWDETHTISSIDWSLLVQQNKSGDLSGIYSGFTNANISYIINSIYSDNTTILLKNSNRILAATNNYEADLLRTISSRLLRLHEPFDPSKSPFASDKCHRDMAKYLSSLKNFDLWALQMYDSSAKLPPGILSGNINQFGDFDECMQASFDDNQHYIEPQYCLAYLQPEIIDGFPTLNRYHRMVQSNFMFTSNFDDPGHRVPRFSTINWAICVPASCSYKDVEQVLSDFTSNITQGTGIHLKVRVDKEMCQRPTYQISLGSKLAMAFFGIILLISVFSTFYDFNTKIQNPWFVVFSLLKNTKALFSTERAHDDIKSIHGIRFLNAIMLIMAHKSMALFYAPYVNRTGMTEILGQYWTVLGRAASLYTDPFIMISGLLTTYAFVGRLQKGNNIKIRQEYISRLIRILPPLLALIYFCTFILPLLGSGPLWNMVVTPHSELCKRNWWRNLLFIHNYFGFENMCLNHTHHVGIDTQLFVLVPFMILLLWKYPKPGATFLTGIAVLSTIGRYQITILKRLNNYVYFGTSVQSLFDTANFMYIIPPYRITVYIMGVILGYLLRTKKGLKLTQGQLKIGWYINVLLWMAAFFGPAPMGKIDYQYNPTHAAYYAAFAPIAWCSFFGWVIFTSHLGYESGLSRFFSWKGFLVATRLSYAIYLTQFPVFFFNVGKVRHSGQYNFITQISNVHELSWIVLTSIMLTIFFETPFGNINKILFPTKRKVLQAQSLPTKPTDNIEVLDRDINDHKEDKPLFCDT